MKPTQRKEFFQENREKLTAGQMASVLGVGLPTIRNYEKEFGQCLPTPQTKESFSDFLIKAKTGKELGLAFKDWEERLKEKYDARS